MTLHLLSHLDNISNLPFPCDFPIPLQWECPPYLLGPGPPHQCVPFINPHQKVSVPHSSHPGFPRVLYFIHIKGRMCLGWWVLPWQSTGTTTTSFPGWGWLQSSEVRAGRAVPRSPSLMSGITTVMLFFRKCIWQMTMRLVVLPQCRTVQPTLNNFWASWDYCPFHTRFKEKQPILGSPRRGKKQQHVKRLFALSWNVVFLLSPS